MPGASSDAHRKLTKDMLKLEMTDRRKLGIPKLVRLVAHTGGLGDATMRTSGGALPTTPWRIRESFFLLMAPGQADAEEAAARLGENVKAATAQSSGWVRPSDIDGRVMLAAQGGLEGVIGQVDDLYRSRKKSSAEEREAAERTAKMLVEIGPYNDPRNFTWVWPMSARLVVRGVTGYGNLYHPPSKAGMLRITVAMDGVWIPPPADNPDRPAEDEIPLILLDQLYVPMPAAEEPYSKAWEVPLNLMSIKAGAPLQHVQLVEDMLRAFQTPGEDSRSRRLFVDVDALVDINPDTGEVGAYPNQDAPQKAKFAVRLASYTYQIEYRWTDVRREYARHQNDAEEMGHHGESPQERYESIKKGLPPLERMRIASKGVIERYKKKKWSQGSAVIIVAAKQQPFITQYDPIQAPVRAEFAADEYKETKDDAMDGDDEQPDPSADLHAKNRERDDHARRLKYAEKALEHGGGFDRMKSDRKFVHEWHSVLETALKDVTDKLKADESLETDEEFKRRGKQLASWMVEVADWILKFEKKKLGDEDFVESYNQATLFLDNVAILVWDKTYSEQAFSAQGGFGGYKGREGDVDDDADDLEENTSGGGAGQEDDVEERDDPLAYNAEDTIEDFD
mgnify:CR=1 FL=1